MSALIVKAAEVFAGCEVYSEVGCPSSVRVDLSCEWNIKSSASWLEFCLVSSMAFSGCIEALCHAI